MRPSILSTPTYNRAVSLDFVVTTWIVVAVIAAVIEVSIPHFGMIFVSVAAVAAAIVAFLGYGAVAQSTVFVVVLVLTFALVRPRFRSQLDAVGVPSRTQALIGREGVVTFDIEATVGAGRVNVGGEDWAARAKSPLQAGTRIRVVAADGVVLEVAPV